MQIVLSPGAGATLALVPWGQSTPACGLRGRRVLDVWQMHTASVHVRQAGFTGSLVVLPVVVTCSSQHYQCWGRVYLIASRYLDGLPTAFEPLLLAWGRAVIPCSFWPVSPAVACLPSCRDLYEGSM